MLNSNPQPEALNLNPEKNYLKKYYLIILRVMVVGQVLKDLPEEVILNISSFLIGKPEYFNLKKNKIFKQIQKDFKIVYSKPHTFDLDTDVIEMNYYIYGSRLNPSIIKNQESTIVKFIENTFLKLNKDRSMWKVLIDITLYHSRIVKTAGASWDSYEVFMKRGYMKDIKNDFVFITLNKCIEAMNKELSRHRRWMNEDKENRRFKTKDFRINIEMEKLVDSDSGSD